MKKAQGISMNVIIIAALALLVLVVLSIIFLGRTGQWSSNTVDCRGNGGDCFAQGQCDDGTKHYAPWDAGCDTDAQEWCCIALT